MSFSLSLEHPSTALQPKESYLILIFKLKHHLFYEASLISLEMALSSLPHGLWVHWSGEKPHTLCFTFIISVHSHSHPMRW